MDIFGLELLDQRRLFLCERFQALLRRRGGLFRGPTQPAERGRGKAKAAQRLLCRGKLLPHTQQRQVTRVLVLADREQLRLVRRFAQRGHHGGAAHLRGDRAKHQLGALRSGRLQRQIQLHPGLQRLDHTAKPRFLRRDAADLLMLVRNGLRDAQRLVDAVVLQKNLTRELRLCREQPALHRDVLPQQLQRMVKRRLPGAYSHQAAALRAQALGLTQLLPGLGDLHAAELCQLAQERILPGTNGHQPKPFHS